MKYNDNGEYKDIYVKAFDTLPIGTIVEFDGTTIPDGWEDIGNNKIKKTSQYIEGGATLSNEYGTSQSDGYSQEYSNLTFGGKILWSNSSPNSSFTSQTITLNESVDNYKYIKVFYRASTGNDIVYSKELQLVNISNTKILLLYYFAGDEQNTTLIFRSRKITNINGTSVVVGNGQQKQVTGNTITEDNNQCIPYQIIGYK